MGRSKQDQNTAAYAASQPLLNAITYAETKIGQQRRNLKVAHDIVRNIHIQIPSATGTNNVQQHDRSLDSVVAAWKNATEAYTEIFESLANITAADATLGKPASKGHSEFKSMAETAKMANKVATEWVPAETIKPLRSSPSKAAGEQDEDAMDQEGPAPAKQQKPLERLSEKMRIDSKGPKHLWDVGAEEPNVPFGTLGPSEKKARKHEKLRQKREKKREAGMAKREKVRVQNSAAEENATKPGHERDFLSLNPDITGQVPDVVYEDVSAEVEARLKSKEEAKQAKKKEKKRKRESGDSSTLVPDETLNPTDHAQDERLPEKPLSKRKKSNRGGEGPGEEVGSREKKSTKKDRGESTVEKRKSVNGDDIPDERRKKRKKA